MTHCYSADPLDLGQIHHDPLHLGQIEVVIPGELCSKFSSGLKPHAISS